MIRAKREQIERLNLYITPELRVRIRRVMFLREFPSEGYTARWLIEKALDWWERLPTSERDTA